MKSASGRWLILILGVALGLRVALALLHPMMFPDSADYDALGRAIVAGQAYEVGGNVASRMPGYPVMVAAVYVVAGPSVKAVLIVQAVMGTAVVGLVYGIGKKVAGEGVGLMAAGLAAVDPLSVAFSAALLTEVPFMLVLVGGVWMVVDQPGFRNPKVEWLRWAGLGLLWAVGVYLRASALWCVVPFVALAGWHRKNGRGALLAVLVTLALLLPWQLRNQGIFHERFFRLTTLEGISLYEAVYPEADGGPQQHKLAVPAEIAALGESARDTEWGRRGWSYVRSDPFRVIGLGVVKVGRTWSPWLNAAEFQEGRVQAVLTAWHVPLFVLGLLGAGTALARREWRFAGMVMLVPVVYFTLVHALYLGSVRYRVPLMPLVCLFAALGMKKVWEWLRRGKPSAAGDV